MSIALVSPRPPADPLRWLRRGTGRVLSFLGVALGLAVIWEGYKAFGQAVDDHVFGWELPVATNDLAMPHVWEIVGSLFRPTRRGQSEILLVTLLKESVSTVRTAIVGFIVGSVAGWLMAVVMTRFKPLEHGLLPWLVASQTVPLVAIAPMIVIWGGKIGLPDWGAVAAIAVYLAFFPVTVNSLRGLTSAGTLQLDLFRSWGASGGSVMRYLRMPGSLGHVFAGLRLAATASVIGTLVGELSVGTGKGLGRAILNFSYFYSNGPEKLFAAVIVASLVGMAFVGAVALVERFAMRHRPPTAEVI